MSARSPLAEARGLRLALVGLPLVWLGLFFLGPSLLVLAMSLGEAGDAAQPAILPWDRAAGPSAAAYALIAGEPLYREALWNALRLGLWTTLAAALIGYPIAFGIARSRQPWRTVLLLLVILPFWTSFLIRVYAWVGLLGPDGLVNAVLGGLGLIAEPLQLLATPGAVIVGMAYTYLPFFVLPLYAQLEKHEPALVEAAADLGARPWRAFRDVTLPLSLPGVLAGALLVLIPSFGEVVVPELLGGPDTLMLGQVIWTEFFSNRDWPVASAVAIVMLALLVGPILLLDWTRGRE